MSGIEIAGLVVPLLLTALQNWDNCVRPFKRMKNFDREAQDFYDEVDIQRAIFRNECSLLLQEVEPHDVVNRMLEILQHEGWRDETIDRNLARLLGASLDGICLTIRLLNQELCRIDKATKGLTEVVSAALQETPKSLRDKTWKRGVGKKLRFSFSEKCLKNSLSKLESLNHSLLYLSSQTRRSLVASKGAGERLSHATKAQIQRFQAIGKVSCQMYKALSRACTKHTEHLAHFGVEVEHVEFDGDLFARVKFSMAFTHQNLNDMASHSEPVWFLVDSQIDERMKVTSNVGKNDLDSKEPFLEGAARGIPKEATKHRKRKRFHFPEHVSVPSPGSSTIINKVTLDRSREHDLCDYLRRYFCPPPPKDTFVILEHPGQCRHVVLPSALTGCVEAKQALSLGQLICRELPVDAMTGIVTGVPMYARIKLAKVLAVTVLQYHNTPWLNQLWTSEDIYFFEPRANKSIESIPDISAPHLNAKVTEQEKTKTPSTKRTIARNPVIFSLGAVMIELAYGASLDQLQQPCDLENGSTNQRFFTARRLAKQANSPMGARYNDIVEQLVECIFPKGDNLNDDQVQPKLYEDVVCPLETLERDFENLYLGKRMT